MLVSDSAAQPALTDAAAAGHGHHGNEERVLCVARTIADLDNHPEVTREHVLEALTFAMPCIATTRA
jgi:predicted ATPase with chaperone activity